MTKNAISAVADKLFADCAKLAKKPTPPLKKPKVAVKQRKKLFDKLDREDFTILQDCKPEQVRINVEEKGAGLRIIHKGRRVRFFGWTLRGKRVAIEECLKDAWDLACKEYEVECPYEWLWH